MPSDLDVFKAPVREPSFMVVMPNVATAAANKAAIKIGKAKISGKGNT